MTGLDVRKLARMLPNTDCKSLHFEEVFNPVTGRFESVNVYLNDQSTPAFTFGRNQLSMTLECADILKQLALELGLVSEIVLSFGEDESDRQIWQPVVVDDAGCSDLDAAVAEFLRFAA